MPYDTLYVYLWKFANIKLYGVLLCRLLAPVILVVLLWISRIITSAAVEIFAVTFALILYFLPAVINIFID